MNPCNRDDLFIGQTVDIVLKKDQGSNKRTRGKIKRILTNSKYHSRGIKVMLEENDAVGRVVAIVM